MSTAINVFLKTVIREKGISFNLKLKEDNNESDDENIISEDKVDYITDSKLMNININIKVGSHVKEKAEEVLKDIGIMPTRAVNMFYKQIIINNGIPFKNIKMRLLI